MPQEQTGASHSSSSAISCDSVNCQLKLEENGETVSSAEVNSKDGAQEDIAVSSYMRSLCLTWVFAISKNRA
jgi:hypothetical protein